MAWGGKEGWMLVVGVGVCEGDDMVGIRYWVVCIWGKLWVRSICRLIRALMCLLSMFCRGCVLWKRKVATCPDERCVWGAKAYSRNEPVGLHAALLIGVLLIL